MPWLLIALWAPVLGALGSYTDKYLLVHHRSTGGIGSVIIFSCLFAGFVIPATLYFGAVPGLVSPPEALLLMVNGAITVGTLAAYLYAIKDEDIVSVVPVLQTVPVFGFLTGYALLGEMLTRQELVGGALIVVSAMLLSVEIEEEAHARFRARSFALALVSAFLFALSGAVFKYIADERGYWTAQFWEYVGIGLVGAVLFASMASYRTAFMRVLGRGRLKVAGLNLLTESLTVSSDLIVNYASLLAPIALVYTVNSFQPAFILLFALCGVALVPRFMLRLGALRRNAFLKAFAIAVMLLGSYVVYAA